jgi:hypothetical protein
MTSETKVPMPEPDFYAGPDADGEPQYTCCSDQVKAYGDQRASERDAFWMAKVAELKFDAKRYRTIRAGYIDLTLQLRNAADCFDVKTIKANLNHGDEGEGKALDALIDSEFNPRAGETA